MAGADVQLDPFHVLLVLKDGDGGFAPPPKTAAVEVPPAKPFENPQGYSAGAAAAVQLDPLYSSTLSIPAQLGGHSPPTCIKAVLVPVPVAFCLAVDLLGPPVHEDPSKNCVAVPLPGGVSPLQTIPAVCGPPPVAYPIFTGHALGLAVHDVPLYNSVNPVIGPVGVVPPTFTAAGVEPKEAPLADGLPNDPPLAHAAAVST